MDSRKDWMRRMNTFRRLSDPQQSLSLSWPQIKRVAIEIEDSAAKSQILRSQQTGGITLTSRKSFGKVTKCHANVGDLEIAELQLSKMRVTHAASSHTKSTRVQTCVISANSRITRKLSIEYCEAGSGINHQFTGDAIHNGRDLKVIINQG